MTTTFILNLIAAIAIVSALTGVCRLAFRVAGGLLEPLELAPESPAEPKAERLAA